MLLNQKLLELPDDDVMQQQAFAHANDVLNRAVGGGLQKGSDIIHMDAQVNVDFENVKTVMGEPGVSMVGTATATGTDNLPVLNQVAPPTAPQAGMAPQQAAPITHDCGGLNTLSVWRSGRTAAAKVDALASHGIDEIEIPAFLRKLAV